MGVEEPDIHPSESKNRICVAPAIDLNPFASIPVALEGEADETIHKMMEPKRLRDHDERRKVSSRLSSSHPAY